MQTLEVSVAVRPLYGPLGVKELNRIVLNYRIQILSIRHF